jgi:hypothetical protein
MTTSEINRLENIINTFFQPLSQSIPTSPTLTQLLDVLETELTNVDNRIETIALPFSFGPPVPIKENLNTIESQFTLLNSIADTMEPKIRRMLEDLKPNVSDPNELVVFNITTPSLSGKLTEYTNVLEEISGDPNNNFIGGEIQEIKQDIYDIIGQNVNIDFDQNIAQIITELITNLNNRSASLTPIVQFIYDDIKPNTTNVSTINTGINITSTNFFDIIDTLEDRLLELSGNQSNSFSDGELFLRKQEIYDVLFGFTDNLSFSGPIASGLLSIQNLFSTKFSIIDNLPNQINTIENLRLNLESYYDLLAFDIALIDVKLSNCFLSGTIINSTKSCNYLTDGNSNRAPSFSNFSEIIEYINGSTNTDSLIDRIEDYTNRLKVLFDGSNDPDLDNGTNSSNNGSGLRYYLQLLERELNEAFANTNNVNTNIERIYGISFPSNTTDTVQQLRTNSENTLSFLNAQNEIGSSQSTTTQSVDNSESTTTIVDTTIDTTDTTNTTLDDETTLALLYTTILKIGTCINTNFTSTSTQFESIQNTLVDLLTISTNLDTIKDELLKGKGYEICIDKPIPTYDLLELTNNIKSDIVCIQNQLKNKCPNDCINSTIGCCSSLNTIKSIVKKINCNTCEKASMNNNYGNSLYEQYRIKHYNAHNNSTNNNEIISYDELVEKIKKDVDMNSSTNDIESETLSSFSFESTSLKNLMADSASCKKYFIN